MAKKLPDSEDLERMKGNKLPPVQERPLPGWMRKKVREEEPKPILVRLIEPEPEKSKNKIFRKKAYKKTHPKLFKD